MRTLQELSPQERDMVFILVDRSMQVHRALHDQEPDFDVQQGFVLHARAEVEDSMQRSITEHLSGAKNPRGAAV